jgi:hypothetical protein
MSAAAQDQNKKKAHCVITAHGHPHGWVGACTVAACWSNDGQMGCMALSGAMCGLLRLQAKNKHSTTFGGPDNDTERCKLKAEAGIFQSFRFPQHQVTQPSMQTALLYIIRVQTRKNMHLKFQ